MRVRFGEALNAGWNGGRVAKSAGAPIGYTPHTVVTEWLTLNCVGPWACQARRAWIDILFAHPDDARRARDHFGARWCGDA